MIVHCTGCEARFRVPDEKVGPRGARIRCSRCRTLFAVGPPGAATASTPLPSALVAPTASTPLPSALAAHGDRPEVELETPPPAPRLEIASDDPFAGFRLDAGPPFGPPRAGSEPDLDAFAPRADAPVEPHLGLPAGGFDPLAPGRTAQVGRLDGGSVGAPEPPWAGGVDALDDGTSAAHGAADALAEPAWMDEPFAAARSPRAGRSGGSDRSLPLTDLSDLLGEPERPPGGPPPLPSSRGAARAEEPGPGLDGPDLALEEPASRAPARAEQDAFGDLAFDAGEPRGGPSELGALAADDQAPLALATEAVPGLPEMWRDGPTHAAEPEEAAVTAPGAAPAPGGAADAATDAAPPAAPGAGRASLRSIAVNAASLAALLVLAVGFRVLWRGGAGAGAGRAGAPAALRALGLGGLHGAALETARVTSGRYPRALGPPLLFVRGEVVSRAPGPLGRIRVDVELVRDGRPIAARSALAGAVPSAEELHDVKDAAALDALSAAAPAQRAAERVADRGHLGGAEDQERHEQHDEEIGHRERAADADSAVG